MEENLNIFLDLIFHDRIFFSLEDMKRA